MIDCDKHGEVSGIAFSDTKEMLGFFCMKCFVEKLKELGLKDYKEK